MSHHPTGVLLVMAGGTGGHIMPGLAVAKVLQQQGWQVVWLGNSARMEGRLVPEAGIPLKSIDFSGLRGKGAAALIKLPLALFRAFRQARKIIAEQRPDVVLGMGGYVSVPGGLAAAHARIPLVIHEQNAVAGSANRLLKRFCKACCTGFPDVLPDSMFTGNPVRPSFLSLAPAQERYQARSGPLNILVVGGSLGAKALNEVVPAALARLPEAQRPTVTHQSGEQHFEALQQRYREAGVEARCVAFISDMAHEMAQADLIICRAGAMTVAEAAAAGTAALFVPLPGAIDNHQWHNARWLSACGAALLAEQSALSPENLSALLASQSRAELMKIACKAESMARGHAAEEIAAQCQKFLKERNET